LSGFCSLSALHHYRKEQVGSGLGWLSLFAAFGIAGSGAVFVGLALEGQRELTGQRSFKKAVGIVLFGLSVGLFFGGRWVLKQAGLSLYRKKR